MDVKIELKFLGFLTMITEKKWQELNARMEELEIFEQDLDEKFILASGRGGQKQNLRIKTD